MRRQDFCYDLPPELIAQAPPAERSAGRMLVLDGRSGASADRTVRDLPAHLERGDLLVVNDTRVIAARALGSKLSGGRVEILLERALAGREALAQLSASKPIREGLEITTAGGTVRVLGREQDLWRLALPAPALEFFERCGEVPLPPYIRRAPLPEDRERYQSIFARQPGAVAAPTASLHFDAALTAALAARGVECARITLHIGAGTFQPVRGDDLAGHVLHAEYACVGAATCEAIARTRARGGRVVAVGTTVVRALESAALAQGRRLSEPALAPENRRTEPALAPEKRPLEPTLAPWSGETRLFITPGFSFQVSDLLLTNFHLPESTLLMLVCAFAGRENVLAAYRHAVAQRYRFFSYGDAMLVTRRLA
ncbi:MAG TPA: tRNA preQ1(34) S-adenosylmethionine ribosyltransferase-isomerase QueA [Steroidobacteraceae bacterium]|nr:tRNA preQ1(34) S-adenosylmethionine ribosyltransferase-isomerase QueA [Steroidobacteraceae bacterium]